MPGLTPQEGLELFEKAFPSGVRYREYTQADDDRLEHANPPTARNAKSESEADHFMSSSTTRSYGNRSRGVLPRSRPGGARAVTVAVERLERVDGEQIPVGVRVPL